MLLCQIIVLLCQIIISFIIWKRDVGYITRSSRTIEKVSINSDMINDFSENEDDEEFICQDIVFPTSSSHKVHFFSRSEQNIQYHFTE